MHYTDYVRRINAEYPLSKFDSFDREIGPLHNPTVLPGCPPWRMDWAVLFSDGLYALVKERWIADSQTALRSANLGRRQHFGFHYGVASKTLDVRGIPVMDNSLQTIIRIDEDRNPPHIHFGGEDHIPQSRVDGLNIKSADPFEFMRAVKLHRATGRGFDEILKFKVIP